MTILITNQITGRTTVHNAKDLLAEARASVKGKGKFLRYHLSVQDGAPTGATVSLCADYQQPNGLCAQVNTAI